MQTQTFSRFLISVLVLVSLYGCETSTGDPGNCDETKWEQSKSRDFHPYIYIETDTLPGSDHYNWLAEGLFVSGTIQKMYCNGTSGTSLDFFYNTAPINHNLAVFVNPHRVIQSYGFNFNNDKDYLSVIFRLKYNFPDGKKYETGEIIKKYYFKDIQYLDGDDEFQIRLFAPNGLTYYEVAAK